MVIRFVGAFNTLIQKTIGVAHSKGILMIASAGNNGSFNKKKNYPGAYDDVIAIAASDQFGRVANFSSAGSYVEFIAPGVNIWSAVPGGGKAMSGTSFSAPIVTAYAAAIKKYKGISDLKSVREYFRKNAQDRRKADWNKYSGRGFVGIPSPC